MTRKSNFKLLLANLLLIISSLDPSSSHLFIYVDVSLFILQKIDFQAADLQKIENQQVHRRKSSVDPRIYLPEEKNAKNQENDLTR